ncbi:hypothetical protein AVEN_160100-1 [Araneus ventricosus]|uniref:Uncharacterized protein n=1 Tax=Araneus ventricosus TaxID=182803 RepID=A0A4Y2GHY3_ARAVE|nr:hypothetical protein AVEN_160100-1 [Araneus ventricosus]
MLSRLDYDQEIPFCEENTVAIDFPARSSLQIREEQLKDEDPRKITHCFDNDDKDVNDLVRKRVSMNQGVLYRYYMTLKAQLVVLSHERDKMLKEHHDSPNAAHYGSDGTYQRIAKLLFLDRYEEVHNQLCQKLS